MVNDYELLDHIHQNADMGRSAVKNLIDRTTDTNLVSVLNNQLDEYERAYTLSGNMLYDSDISPEDASRMSKTMASMSTNFKMMKDDSVSKIAEMAIQGSTMGITKLTQQINDYSGKNKDVIDLAKSQIKTEQNNIETLKKFL